MKQTRQTSSGIAPYEKHSYDRRALDQYYGEQVNRPTDNSPYDTRFGASTTLQPRHLMGGLPLTGKKEEKEYSPLRGAGGIPRYQVS
jgi:hypothetical protein